MLPCTTKMYCTKKLFFLSNCTELKYIGNKLPVIQTPQNLMQVDKVNLHQVFIRFVCLFVCLSCFRFIEKPRGRCKDVRYSLCLNHVQPPPLPTFPIRVVHHLSLWVPCVPSIRRNEEWHALTVVIYTIFQHPKDLLCSAILPVLLYQFWVILEHSGLT